LCKFTAYTQQQFRAATKLGRHTGIEQPEHYSFKRFYAVCHDSKAASLEHKVVDMIMQLIPSICALFCSQFNVLFHSFAVVIDGGGGCCLDLTAIPG
jgi:hypothetical protein